VDKLRRSRDLLAHTLSNYEEALEKVKKMGYLSKTSMKEKEAMQKLMENTMEKVKQHLVKGEKNKLQVLKDLLAETVKVVKDAKDEAKELVQITMKTQSKASGK
jgi:GTPase involved in cell partitioning and DNA repair